ncbi:MAG: SDR family oxidoreductase [Candidatus Wallbacteria bacterium]|nr:SDR family oxidoreductase [Candidatus Wallbacteria bacterium]
MSGSESAASNRWLQGKVALVTGAARGIGLASARLLAGHGATVYLSGRRLELLEALAQEVSEQSGAVVRSLLLDVTDPASVSKAFGSIHRENKGLDVLVNNAGVLKDALIGMVGAEDMATVFGVNTFGVLHCCQYASRLMARRGGGSIVNVSSIIGVTGNAGQAVYAASKSAVIGITKSLAKELAPQNIRVNAVAPGFIDTDMARSLSPEKFQERVDSIKMKRIGTAEDVAGVILFLASPLAEYVTGQTIGVDGGMLI